MVDSRLPTATTPLVGDGNRRRVSKACTRCLSYTIAVVVVIFVFFLTNGTNILHSLFDGISPVCQGVIYRNGSTHPASDSFSILPSGDKIPNVALGVWQATNSEVGPAVKAALASGYRHIDDAWVYRNEIAVGKAIRESGVPRGEIFLTSKLWNSFHSPEDIEPTLDESLSNFQTPYLDLYLIHWPVAFKKEESEGGKLAIDMDLTENPYPTWKKLEEMVDKGKVRNIGVSNFNIRRFQNLTANPLKYLPAVNQVELNFWNPQPELVKWAIENNVILEAYSPLGSSSQVERSLNVPEVKAAAKSLGMTPAQVIISWHVQRGTVVLPKSVHACRVEENFQIATLPSDIFNSIETAATSHPPQRQSDPSKDWGLGFDIFD